jgi:uncharacterized protein (TIGR02246 family)
MVFACLVAMTACQSRPADISESDRAAVRAQLDTYMRAALAGDAEAWGRTLAEDVVLLPPGSPPLQGRTAAINWLKTLPKLTAFTVDVADISGSGDVAYARGAYKLAMTAPDGSAMSDHGKFLDVHRRASDGTWPYVRATWHSDAAVPSANAVDAVKAAVASHWDAINKGDVTAVGSQHTSDFTMTLANFEKVPPLAYFEKARANWQLRDVEVTPLAPNVMLATFNMDGSYTSPEGRVDRRQRRVTEIWVNQGGTWKESHHHDSVFAP